MTHYDLDCGHNAPSGDTGARGLKFEDVLAKQVTQKLKEKLEDAGHKVTLVAPTEASTVIESLSERCAKSNASSADRFVSIHFNAFNGSANGTEVWLYSPQSKFNEVAEDVVDNIAALGFANRGVKYKGFYVLRYTRKPGMLIECCFVDNQKDMSLFDADKMADAIARGLLGGAVCPKPPITKAKEKATLEVVVATLLKPTTEQSSEISKNEMKNIAVGEYPVTLLADEEGHYLVEFEDSAYPGDWFIFSKHCKLIK